MNRLSYQETIFLTLFYANLTLYHTIPTYNTPPSPGFLKTLWEKEKMLVMLFTQPQVLKTLRDKAFENMLGKG